MDLIEEFKQILEFNYLYGLNDDVIIPYIVNCFQSLSNFIKEKTHTSIRFTYGNTDKILQGLYKIGVENCQKQYDHYNNILKFKEQFEIDFRLMLQTQQRYYNLYSLSNFAIFKINDDDTKKDLQKEMEFYINKYKFYNSFKITLS